MDRKYNMFHDNFEQTSKKAKELDQKIKNACNTILKLKDNMKEKKVNAYLRRYRAKEIETILTSLYHDEPNPSTVQQKLKHLLEEI